MSNGHHNITIQYIQCALFAKLQGRRSGDPPNMVRLVLLGSWEPNMLSGTRTDPRSEVEGNPFFVETNLPRQTMESSNFIHVRIASLRKVSTGWPERKPAQLHSKGPRGRRSNSDVRTVPGTEKPVLNSAPKAQSIGKRWKDSIHVPHPGAPESSQGATHRHQCHVKKTAIGDKVYRY